MLRDRCDRCCQHSRRDACGILTFMTVEILVAIVTSMVVAALTDVMECHRADGLMQMTSCGLHCMNSLVGPHYAITSCRFHRVDFIAASGVIPEN